jgi:uncharacterized repeat protein (TIGR01451 family)
MISIPWPKGVLCRTPIIPRRIFRLSGSAVITIIIIILFGLCLGGIAKPDSCNLSSNCSAYPGLGNNVSSGTCPSDDFHSVAGLEELIRDQSRLLMSFDDLLLKTPTTVNQKIVFLGSFEDLVRRQSMLISEFDDILKMSWKDMDCEEQGAFLRSFEDLTERNYVILGKFENVTEQGWLEYDSKNKTKLLASYEDLVRRQSQLIKNYEDLYKRTYDGISIEKSVDKNVAHLGDTLTYNYIVTNEYTTQSISNISIIDDVLGQIASNVTLDPLETRYFSKSTALRGDSCNKAIVTGVSSNGKPLREESNIVCVNFMRDNRNYASVRSGNQNSIALGSDPKASANVLEIDKNQKSNNDDLHELSNTENIELGSQNSLSTAKGNSNNQIRISSSQE